jgi:hypothetical protein
MPKEIEGRHWVIGGNFYPKQSYGVAFSFVLFVHLVANLLCGRAGSSGGTACRVASDIQRGTRAWERLKGNISRGDADNTQKAREKNCRGWGIGNG